MVVSAGMLMVAYWFLEKRMIPWWHAFFAIVGLFFIRMLIGDFMSVLPLSFLWWWLLTAVYFHFVLPGPLPTWETAVLALLQQLFVYLFSLAVLALGVITTAHPSAMPPNPVIKPAPNLVSRQVSPLNPTAPVQNPASAVLRPPPEEQPLPAGRPAVTLSGMARTLDPTAPNSRAPGSEAPGKPYQNIYTSGENVNVPAATLPVPTPEPMGNSPAQMSVNTVIPESAVPPPAPRNDGIIIAPIPEPQPVQ